MPLNCSSSFIIGRIVKIFLAKCCSLSVLHVAMVTDDVTSGLKLSVSFLTLSKFKKLFSTRNHYGTLPNHYFLETTLNSVFFDVSIDALPPSIREIRPIKGLGKMTFIVKYLRNGYEYRAGT